MSELRKVRVQLLNSETNEVIEEVDTLTSANAVTFSDGETFQQKLENGKLKGERGDSGANGVAGTNGEKGDKGDKGDSGVNGIDGAKGDKGDKGDPGDTVKVGTTTENAIERKLFFKVV